MSDNVILFVMFLVVFFPYIEIGNLIKIRGFLVWLIENS